MASTGKCIYGKCALTKHAANGLMWSAEVRGWQEDKEETSDVGA